MAKINPIQFALPSTAQGRLTLESLVPVSTTDQTAKTTLYYTPYIGDVLGLWDGTKWVNIQFSETSISLASISANTNYDVFGYLNNGLLALELLAWTNDTTRATALVRQNGILCKSGALTRRYLGTIRGSASGQCEDSGKNRFVWNMNNRVTRKIVCVPDNYNSWTYAVNSFRQGSNNSGYKVQVVIGLSEDLLKLSAGLLIISNSGDNYVYGIGLDRVNAEDTEGLPNNYHNSGNTVYFNVMPILERILTPGYHYLALVEKSISATTVTVYPNTNILYGFIIC